MALGSLSDAVKVSREFIDKHKIFEVFRDGIDEIKNALPELTPTVTSIEKDECKSITIGLFDLHFGQLIKLANSENNEISVTFNNDIAAELLDDVFLKAIKIIDSNKKQLCEINVALGGDLIEGDSSIFPGQVHVMSSSLSEQLKRVTLEITKHIVTLANKYKKIPINIYAIAGNHGEIRGSFAKKLRDNYDIIVANYIEMALRQRNVLKGDMSNVSFNTSLDSLSAYIKTCNNHIIEVIHEMPRNLMSPSAERFILARKSGWNVDLIFTGHFHAPAFHEVGEVKVVRSGSLGGPNQYSQKLGIPPNSRQQTIIIGNQSDVASMIINIKPELH